MKKRFFIYSVLAALLMTGCSKSEEDLLQNEEAVNGEAVNGENGGEFKTSYLTVNLMSADGGAGARTTRADETVEKIEYEDGTGDENKVTKVRFYFFTETGDPANVKLLDGKYVNYYDWSPADGAQTADTEIDYVESLLTATIVINTKSGDKLPQTVAAVINPTETTVQARSLQDLKTLTNDYAKADLTTEGTFVMFNSVYAENSTEVCATPIMAANLAKSEDEAKANPVTLYVERNVAKVNFKLGNNTQTATTGKLALKDKDGKDIIVDGKQVYLKIEGWSLTADTDLGRLGKKINPEWDGTWWNRSSDHRSFWAINASGAENLYHSYNGINTNITNSLYTNENARNYTDASGNMKNLNRTKVIIKGTLLDENEEKFTVVRHLGVYLADKFDGETESENLPLLKNSILSQLKANGHNYYYTTLEDVFNAEKGEMEKQTVYNQIAPEDLKIKITDQIKDENSKNNCYVIAELNPLTTADKNWYDSDDPKTAKSVTATTINENLANKEIVDRALVWKEGMTYYYFEIIHRNVGAEPLKGVVRNHIYETTVTKIAGLGTPVYEPGKTIYPEKPDDNDHYIAADIKILSWRIVKNDYELKW